MTGVTRAAGEDYFAMLMGYPYIVRMTRNLINKYSPGFKYDSDNALNGGSFKVNDKGDIVGNYQLEGMADLGMRFTAYNIFTKFYRDLYDVMGARIKLWWGGEEPLRFSKPDPIAAIKRSANYLVRTTIKMVGIMIPSTFFFYIARSPQSKDIGLAIHPKYGPIGFMGGQRFFTQY